MHITLIVVTLAGIFSIVVKGHNALHLNKSSFLVILFLV